MQRPLRQHTETVAALRSALFRFCALDVAACSKLKFTFTFTCMGERMDSCVCVCMWVRVHWCIHAHMYTRMRECLCMCHMPLCLYVCIFVSMHACVYIYIYKIRNSALLLHRIYIYIIHIYAFLLHTAAVFHNSGTFILRSTDGYLILVWSNMIHNAHFVFNFEYALLDPVSCCTWTFNSAHRTAAAYRPTLYTRRCCHNSQSASSHDTVNVVCKWWCLERHSTLPYDNMAT